MPFATSQITFGSYVFPAGFMLHSRDQQTRTDTIPIPFQHGSHTAPGFRNDKLIRVSGTLGGIGSVDSAGAFITTRSQLEAEANLLASSLENGFAALSTGVSPVRTINAQKIKFTSTYLEATNANVITVEIEFSAPDPRWLSNTLTQTLNAGTQTVASAGNAMAYPVFTIHGPAVNPYVQVTPAGYSGYIKIAPVVTLGSSDILTITCDPNPNTRQGAIKLNGTNNLSLLGITGIQNTAGTPDFFPLFNGGANTVVVGATSGAYTASVSWQDAYLF